MSRGGNGVAVWVVLLGWCLCRPSAARADVIYFLGGRMMEGIVVQETAAQIKVQVAWQGYVTLDRDSVVSILRADERERQRLLTEWRKEFLADQQRERERVAYEEAQRPRGLVEHQGRWVTPAELATLKKEQARKEREQREAKAKQEEEAQREAEAREATQRLQALQEENLRLRELVVQQRLLLVPTSVLVERRDPSLFRDEQGNLIRVREHGGHQFFTATDGQHVDLQSHDGHLAFTDAQGLHHDLTCLRE